MISPKTLLSSATRLPAGLRTRRRATTVTAGVLALAVAGSGIAYAVWTVTGSGTASARAGTALPPSVTAVVGTSFTSGFLYPGGTGDLKVSVTNPNPYPVQVTDVLPVAGAVTGSGGIGSCTTTGVSFAGRTLTTGNVYSSHQTKILTLQKAVSMSNAADNGCQNAVFSIPVSVTLVSN